MGTSLEISYDDIVERAARNGNTDILLRAFDEDVLVTYCEQNIKPVRFVNEFGGYALLEAISDDLIMKYVQENLPEEMLSRLTLFDEPDVTGEEKT